MASIDRGNLGGAQSKTAGTALTVVNSSGAIIPAGTLLVLSFVCDNPASVTVPTLTLSAYTGGGSWAANKVTSIGVTTTAGAGIHHFSTWVKTTTNIAVGATIVTCTLSASVVAKAASVDGWGNVGALKTSGSATSAAGTSGTTAMGISGIAIGDLMIECRAQEIAAFDQDTTTSNGTWDTAVAWGTTGGSAITNVVTGIQDKDSTGVTLWSSNIANLSGDQSMHGYVFSPPVLSAPPVAHAGNDQTVNAGATVNLSGSTSTDDVGVTGYAWTQIGGTPTVTLTGAATANASFTAPTGGSATLTFRLTVTDADAQTSTDDIVVTVNQPPVAAAGNDQTVNSGATVNLSGSGSTDDVAVSAYSWAQVGGPSNTPAFRALGAVTTYAARANTTLSAPAGVQDGDLLFAAIFLGVSGTVTLPTAPAGWQLIGTPSNVTLGGFNGRLALYRKIASSEGASWTWTHASYSTQGYVAAYSGVDTVTPLDVTPTVNTGTGTTATYSAITPVTNGAMVLYAAHDWGSTANNLLPPAGTTERVDSALLYMSEFLQTTAAVIASKTQTVNNVTADPWSTFAVAFRPGVLGPTLTGASTSTPSFTAPTVVSPTVYTFRLTVTDAGGLTDTDDVQITVNPAVVNQPPTAAAGSDQIVNPGDTVTLSGTGSTDDVGVSSYSWAYVPVGTSFSDDFNRADTAGAGLSGSWVNAAGVAANRLQIVSNQLAGGTASGWARHSTVTTTDDQFAQATYLGQAYNGLLLGVNPFTLGQSLAALPERWYHIRVEPTTSLISIRIKDASAASFTQLYLSNVAMSIGDVLRAEYVSGVLYVYVNGVLRITHTPSIVVTGQRYVGLGVNATWSNIPLFDDFSGGDYFAAPLVPLTNASTSVATLTAPQVPGDYTFRLTVTDAGGLTNTDDVKITVAAVTAPSTGFEGWGVPIS